MSHFHFSFNLNNKPVISVIYIQGYAINDPQLPAAHPRRVLDSKGAQLP